MDEIGTGALLLESRGIKPQRRPFAERWSPEDVEDVALVAARNGELYLIEDRFDSTFLR